MHIVIIIPSLRFGMRYWRYIVEEFIVNGCDVTIFTFMMPPSIENDHNHKIRVRMLKCLFYKSNNIMKRHQQLLALLNIRNIFNICNTNADAIIAVEYTFATCLALISANRLRIPFIVFQEHCIKHIRKLSFIVKHWRFFIIKHSDLVLANTVQAKDEIYSFFPRYQNKIVVIPLLLPPKPESLLSKEIGIPQMKRRPVFLYIGQLVENKNVSILLKASKLLKDDRKIFSILIAGDGPLRHEMEKYIFLNNMEKDVYFTGLVAYESIGYIYKAADIFVMPTLRDYRSVAVLEAMRFGKPVIDSCYDGNSIGTIFDGINGFIFDPNDVFSLSQIMAKFIEDKKRVSEMGRNAKNAMSNQMLTSSTKKIIDEIKRLIL